MSTSQLDNVREGASTMKVNMAGTDGGWIHPKPLQTRFATPTGIMSFDGESAWSQYDPHILVPKEWGKQCELWEASLRDWPDPDAGMWQTGQKPTWKDINYRRWPLHRIPKCAHRHSAPSPLPNLPSPIGHMSALPRMLAVPHICCGCAPCLLSAHRHTQKNALPLLTYRMLFALVFATGTIARASRSTCKVASTRR